MDSVPERKAGPKRAVWVILALVVAALAGFLAFTLYQENLAWRGQNGDLGRRNSDLNGQLSQARDQAARDNATISDLQARLANLGVQFQAIRNVVNFSSARLLISGNLTIEQHHGYGYQVGTNLTAPGYIAVVFRGGLANSASGLIQGHFGAHFIGRHVMWNVTSEVQRIFLPFPSPMGGTVEFVSDGPATFWVNYVVLYLS